MQTQNRQLREERGRLVAEMKKLSEQGLMTAADKSAFGRLDAEQRRLQERIELIERSDQQYIESRKTGAPPNGQPGVIGPSEEHDREYKRAFNQYLKRGRSELTMEDRAILRHEKRDMGVAGEATGVASGAGVFVPVGFVQKIEDALKYFGPFLNGGNGYPRIMDTDTGQPLPYPTSNDTTVTGELIGEGQQVSTQDVTIAQVIFGAYKLSTKLVKVSLELIEDSAFDLENFLVEEFSKRIGRAVNSFCTTGTGSNQPNGIVTAVTATGPSTTAAGSFTNDGVGGANTIGSDDLVKLEHSVDPLYRPGAAYMANDSTIASLKMIKDKYGRPLWQPSFRDGEPDRVNGYPVLSNPYLATLQTQASSPTVSNTTMLFGAMEKYVIRRVKNLSVLRLSERFADFGQVAFIGFYRFDAQLLDAGTHPVARLVNTY